MESVFWTVLWIIGLLLLWGLASRVSARVERWRAWHSFVRTYKRVPRAQYVGELADRIERLGDCFRDRSRVDAVRAFSRGEVIEPSWEWRLAEDLKELADQVRSNVPFDCYTTYGFLAATAPGKRRDT